MENEKIFGMYFAKVYPMLLAKAERKGRTKDEVNEIACWLTGYDPLMQEIRYLDKLVDELAKGKK